MGPFSALVSILRPRTALELQRLTPRRFSANGATDKRYQELCNLSYSQNDLFSGLELDQLPSLQVDAVPIVHHPLYSAPQLQQGHRFPMQIFQRIHDSLIQDDVVQPEQVIQPRALPSLDMLHLAHDADYVSSFLSGCLRTLLTAQLALEHGLACNTAGGTHHAQHAAGSGFCIINDLAITALLLRAAMPHRAQRVLILDLDVHQGDGTAEILSPQRGGVPPQPSPFSSTRADVPSTRTESNPGAPRNSGDACDDTGTTAAGAAAAQGPGTRGSSSSVHAAHACAGGLGGANELGAGALVPAGLDGGSIFTCSMHAERNFPARKQRSSLDVGLRDGVGDQEYIRTVRDVLDHVLEEFKPDLCLYDAGVDPHKDDALGRLSLSDSGLLQRETLVLDTLWRRGIPVAGYVGGGYQRDLQKLAGWHTLLHRAASTCWNSM